MTDDLVERLRWGAWYYEDPFDGKAYASDDPLEAADLIETQAREIERLREALKTADAWLDRWARHIGDCPGIDDCTCGLTRVRYEAITALAGDSHDQ